MDKPDHPSSGLSAGKVARYSLVVVAIAALALLIWQIVDAILLIFIGVLLAVFFRGLANRLSAHSPLSVGWSLGLVAVTMAALVLAAAWFLGPRISDQFTQLAETMPRTLEDTRQRLEQTQWGRYLLDEVQQDDGGIGAGGKLFSNLTGMTSRVAGVVTEVLLILFAAMFFAIDPDLYKRGAVLLVPQSKAGRVREALEAAGSALWKWLMGKLVAMLFVGVFVTVGLMLLGVPLALVLGLLAGLLDFVPFVGPIASAVPAVLLALTLGPMQALYTALVYFIAQQVEGNVVTPLIQQKEVSLPPVLVLFSVVAAGLVFGLRGIIVATPLVVVTMVFVKMLYIHDALGKDVSIP